eukprot:COSAG01_NODE_5364_length_4308_cov_3.542647_1_plen_61_part_00
MLIDPGLVFADEPTSGLDSAMAESVMEQLQELARGTTAMDTQAAKGGVVKRTVVATIHQP